MGDLDLYDGIRLISVAEAVLVIGLIFLQVALAGGWRQTDARNRFRLSGVALLAFAWGFGAIESIIDGIGGNVRVVLGAIALGYLALAYLSTVRELYNLQDRR